MTRRRVARFARVSAQACVGLALLLDVQQSLELGGCTTERLTSWRMTATRRADPADAGVVTRAAAQAVTSVAWLAAVSLPYAESVEPSPEP